MESLSKTGSPIDGLKGKLEMTVIGTRPYGESDKIEEHVGQVLDDVNQVATKSYLKKPEVRIEYRDMDRVSDGRLPAEAVFKQGFTFGVDRKSVAEYCKVSVKDNG